MSDKTTTLKTKKTAYNIGVYTQLEEFENFKSTSKEDKTFEEYYDLVISLAVPDGTTIQYKLSLDDIAKFKQIVSTPKTKGCKPIFVDVPIVDREDKIEKLRLAFSMSGIHLNYQHCDLIARVMTEIGDMGDGFDLDKGSRINTEWESKWKNYLPSNKESESCSKK